MPGAFKLIYLQPFEPILSQKIFIFSTFIPILCCPFLEETFLTLDEEFEQTSSTGGIVASGKKEELEGNGPIHSRAFMAVICDRKFCQLFEISGFLSLFSL